MPRVSADHVLVSGVGELRAGGVRRQSGAARACALAAAAWSCWVWASAACCQRVGFGLGGEPELAGHVGGAAAWARSTFEDLGFELAAVQAAR